MGTLGCINDMLCRDKENRELRKVSKERLHATHQRLLSVKEALPLPDITSEDLSEIIHQTQIRESAERKHFFRFTLTFLGAILLVILLLAALILLIV
ncbi:hypothetical protein [uncultured Phocaeicola sp.]|uniref:hypothetical protein n=1 Tax=uncultured Phocaeicola sp. TaxID=990718 RepID=UPI0030C76B78